MLRYHDAFAEKAGRDEQWALGTRLNMQIDEETFRLMQESASFRDCVLDPTLQPRLFGSQATPQASGEGQTQAAWEPGYHRTSFVLLQRGAPPQLPSHPVDESFITALAGLSANLPVCMTFTHDDVQSDGKAIVPSLLPISADSHDLAYVHEFY